MKKTTEKAPADKQVKKSVIISPRVTEKAALAADRENMYAFNVTKDCNKKQIIASIKEAYKVTPVKVRMLTVPDKQVMYRGRKGVKRGGKKAYVFLKKGDKIEVM